MLPPEVRALLAGEPDDGAWEPVAHLLTVDDDGFPRVCLLSRAELAAGEDTVSCVVRARHTIANLRRTGQALLVVAGGEAGRYSAVLGPCTGMGYQIVSAEVEPR